MPIAKIKNAVETKRKESRLKEPKTRMKKAKGGHERSESILWATDFYYGHGAKRNQPCNNKHGREKKT